MKRWRVHVTWPGGTATHDVEADQDWQAALAVIRMPGAIPTENQGFAINTTPIPEGS